MYAALAYVSLKVKRVCVIGGMERGREPGSETHVGVSHKSVCQLYGWLPHGENGLNVLQSG